MKKIMKKVISLALTLTLVLSMASVINVSAAETVFLDENMDGSSSVSIWAGSAPEYKEYEGGGADKYLSGKGIYAFGLSGLVSASSTLTISYDMAVSDRNSALELWLNSNTNPVYTYSTDYNNSAWNFMPKLIANKLSYKVVINLATGETSYYVNGTRKHTAVVDGAKNLAVYTIGFTKSADLMLIDNLKVTAVAPKLPDGVLINLDMNTEVDAKNYATWMIQEGPVYAARTTGNNYMGVRGVIGFPFDETIESDRLTFSVDLSGGGGKYNYTGVSVHLNSNATTLKTFSTAELDAWTTWTFEINLVNGQVDLYKNGVFYETTVVDAVKGMKPAYVGFTKWTYQMWIDNLYVQEGLVGTVADYTNEGERTFTNTITTYNFNKAVSGKMVVEYDLKSDGGDYTTASLCSAADSSILATINSHANWVGAGSWIHYKHVIDTDAATVTTYAGDSVEGTVASNVEKLGNGFTANAVRFDNWNKKEKASYIKNFKVYIADPVLTAKEVSGNKYITLTYSNDMDSNGINVKDASGNAVDCTVAVANNVITITCDDLEPASTYTVSGMKDVYGNTVAAVSVTTDSLPTSCGGITVSGKTATAKFYVSKDDNLTNIQCVLASYDVDGILVNAFPVNKTYEVAADDSFDVPLDVTDGYTTLRAFMWTGENVPVLDVTIYPAN